jgi:hypothetical protein
MNAKFVLMAMGVMGVTGVSPLSAELPTLQEKEWLGYFVGVEDKDFLFGVTTAGKSTLRVLDEKGGSISSKLAVALLFEVEEVLPDGRTSVRKILPASLESAQVATTEPKDVAIKGKVKGDAAFEVQVTEDRGVISVGGRLLDRGTLTKYPVRFSVSMKFPSVYLYGKVQADKKKQKAFDEKIENDSVRLIWTDGKKTKLSTNEPLDAKSKEVNGPGISAAEIEFSPYREKKFLVTASEGASLVMANEKAGPLSEGFTLTLVSDPVKDAEGKARLRFEVK